MTAVTATPPAGTSRRVPKGQGRELLIAAAARLFGERGFEVVSTKELALAAGVTIGALYHHFSGKEAIYCAAVVEQLERLPAAPVELAAAACPRDGLDMLVAWFSQTLLTEPLLRQELLDPHLAVALVDLPFFRVSLDMFKRLMPLGAPGVDPDFAITVIVSLSFGMTSLRGISSAYRPPHDSGELARLITGIALGGH